MLSSYKDHLHRGQDVSVSIYTLLARKNRNTGNAIVSEYINSYNSNQFNGVPFLSQIENNGNHYISFSYNKIQRGQAPINEDVLISYPHLSEFNQFLRATYRSISENFENIFQNNQVTDEYSNHVWTSPGFVSNKKISFAPTVIQNRVTNNLEIGFAIIVDDFNKYEFISANSFISLMTLLIQISNDPLTFRNQCVQAEQHAKLIENNQLIKGLLRYQGAPTDMSNHHMDERSNNRNNSGGSQFNNNNNNQFGNFGGNQQQNGFNNNNQFGNFGNAPQQQQQRTQNNFNNNNQFGNFGGNQQQSNTPPQNPFNGSSNNSVSNNNPFQSHNDQDYDIPFNTKEEDNGNTNRQIDKENVFKNDAEPKKESGNFDDLSKTVNNEENKSEEKSSGGKADKLLDNFMSKAKENEGYDDIDL